MIVLIYCTLVLYRTDSKHTAWQCGCKQKVANLIKVMHTYATLLGETLILSCLNIKVLSLGL